MRSSMYSNNNFVKIQNSPSIKYETSYDPKKTNRALFLRKKMNNTKMDSYQKEDLTGRYNLVQDKKRGSLGVEYETTPLIPQAATLTCNAQKLITPIIEPIYYEKPDFLRPFYKSTMNEFGVTE